MNDYITVIGGGLAGCEAAYQIAKAGIKVKLYEMKPIKFSEAHSNENLAEIVCSNSFKSNLLTNACGLLKEELRTLDSLLIRCADETSVPAGQALAVDREKFSELVTKKMKENQNIEIINEEVEKIEKDVITIIATGPLTSEKFTNQIWELTGEEEFYFYDEEGTLDKYVVYEYDEYGNLLEERYYDADGTLREVKNYQNSETDTEAEEELVEVNKQVAQLYYVDILDGGLMYKITYDIEYNADIVQHTREAIGTSMNSVCSIVRFAGEKVGDRYFYSGIESFDGDLQKEAQRLMNQTIYDSRKILAEGEMTVSGYDGYYYETECIYGEDKYSDYYGVVQIDEGRYFCIYGACLDDIWSRNMTSQEFMEAALISAKFVSREETDSWK